MSPVHPKTKYKRAYNIYLPRGNISRRGSFFRDNLGGVNFFREQLGGGIKLFLSKLEEMFELFLERIYIS